MLTLIHTLTANVSGNGSQFKDITGNTSTTAYSKSGNIGYADVDAVRIKIATYTRMQAAARVSFGANFIQYVEYVKIDGAPAVINGKTLGVGSYFVPSSAGIAVPSGDTWQETGYYVPLILNTWLPTAAQVPLDLSLAQMGQAGTIILDDVYTIEYEVYKDVFSTTTTVTPGQYMVLSGTCVFSGNTYYQGNVFTLMSSGSIVISSGSVVKMDSSSTGYSIIAYSLISSILLLQQSLDGKNEPAKDRQVNVIINQLTGLTYSQNTNNVSYEYSRNLLRNLQDRVIQLLSNS
jgi:hypothetical protein